MENLILVGNVGKEPEMRFTPEGKSVLDLSIATYGGKNQDDSKNTVWFEIAFWGRFAEAVNERVKKGMQLRIECQPKDPRIWRQKDGSLWLDADGNPRATNQATGFSFMQMKRTTTYEEIPFENEPEEVKAK